MLTSNIAAKGMNTDVLEKFQEEGTYRFALNAVLETSDGDIRGISNEEGNIYSAKNYPTTKKVIGHALTDTDDIILFLFDPATSRPSHEIGVYNPSSLEYRTIGSGSCLNFKLENQINAIFRLKDGCTKYVYFTDGINPYRVVNISDTKDWVTDGTTIISSCEKIKYSRSTTIPKISGTNSSSYFEGVGDSGGSLDYGTYSFTIRYIDYDDTPTDWLNFTRYFPVSYSLNSSLSNHKSYNEVTAAANIEEEVGYKAKSNKSISLDLTNIDTRFSKYQVAVIKRTATSGAITSVDILQPQLISNPSNTATISTSYVYTGNNGDIFLNTSIEDLFSETIKLDKVVAHTQADNRLFVGGIKKTPKSYTGFQRHASSIKTEYIKTPLNFPNPESKNSAGYQRLTGFMPDEVYSFGIVYIFKDGEHSPVFHIPGRPKDITTVALANNPRITLSGNLDSLTLSGDPNIIDPLQNKRWQVYNTFTRDSTTSDSPSGYLGYYEVNNTYPPFTGVCDTHPDGYWGRDFTGALVTGNIRHHRMPEYVARQNTNTNEHYTCGVKFTVANNYPSLDIVGHYYVTGDRTDGDSTILDTGIINTFNGAVNPLDAIFIQRIGFTSINEGDYMYLSNKTQFNTDLPQGTYLKVMERILEGSYIQDPLTATDISRFNKDILLGLSRYFAQGVPANPISIFDFNYKITDSKIVLRNTKYLEATETGGLASATGTVINTVNGLNVKNISNSLNFGIISTENPIVEFGVSPTTPNTKILRVAIKSLKDVFSTLHTIRYKKTHNNYLTKVDGITLVSNIYEGDSIASQPTFSDNYAFENIDGDIVMRWNGLSMLFDDNINSSFIMYDDRYEGKDTTYRGGYDVVDESANNLLEYLSTKLFKEGDTIGYHYEKYARNKSFDFIQADKIYLPLPGNFDLCSICVDEDFPYRIYYSEADTQESEQDMYRKILPNNYKDLDGYIGKITDMFTFKDNLYALTTNSAVFLPYRPQSIETNEGALYIGTGGVLSLPPKQLKTTDYAFGGTSHFKSRVTTEYGVVYVDDISSRPFMLGEGLSDLSLNGMRNFFQENGQLQLVKQFKEKGISFPYYSTSSPIGVGYITTYEPRYKRVIIHKKDFKINPQFLANFSTFSTEPNTLWWDGSRFVYNDSTGFQSYPNLNDALLFENTSFTISYSFITNSFVSFHSYLPEYMFNNYRNIFSNHIYKHEGNYQNYYGRKYDFIVDYINALNPKEIKTFSHAIIRSRSYYNGMSNTTFDRAIAYNTHQTTGVIYLDKDENFDLSEPSLYSPIKSVDGTFRISSLRDKTISNSNPIWDYSWNFKQNQYYIDKIPNISNIDHSASLFTQQRLKDYYLGLRLFYKPTLNEKIVVDILDTEYLNKNR